MVRTRNSRGGEDSPPGRQPNMSNNLKPSKKGRKRQLTEGDMGGPSAPLCPPNQPPSEGQDGEESDLVASSQLTLQVLVPQLPTGPSERTDEAGGSSLLAGPSIQVCRQPGVDRDMGLVRGGSESGLSRVSEGNLGGRDSESDLHDMQPQGGLQHPHWGDQSGESGPEQGYLTGPVPSDTPSSPLNYNNNTQLEDHASDLVIFREQTVESILPDDLKQNLECPVCARISLPPIMQCRNGHVTCNPCRLKVQSCPMCREIDIDIRNLFAEKAVTFMSIPCEFRTYGCRVEVQYKDKESHERVCKFRPFICPYIECDHKLAADAVVMHVSTAHREECRRSDGPEITASMILIGLYFGGDGAWSPRVITCFGRTFFDVALTRDRWLHHWVWLLGEEEEACNYLYEITAFKGNTKYVYGSEVSSLRTSDDEIVSEGKCLSISDSIGRRLRDGDKIRYKLKLIRK